MMPAPNMKDLPLSSLRQMSQTAINENVIVQANLGLGQLSNKPPKVVINRLKQVIDESKHNGYTPNAGDKEVRTIIAQYVNKKLTKDNVIINVGAQQGIHAAIKGFVGEADEVLIPEVRFPIYGVITERYSLGKPVFVKVDEQFNLDLEDLESKINSRTKMLVLNSPNNPTGHVYSRDHLKAINKLLPEGVVVLSDEVYSCFVYEGEHVSISEFNENTIVINSLSKRAAITGWRFGYTIARKEIIDVLTPVQQYELTCPPSIIQQAVIPCFTSETVEYEVEVFNGLVHKRNIMLELAESYGFNYVNPKGAFYLMLDIKSYGQSKDVALKLLRDKGVMTMPGNAFGRSAEGYIRLSFASSEDEIVKGMRLINQCLNG